jgi:AcrR family transcriptional regulator
VANRAIPLPPDERRASIIAATLPLLRRYGASVTTAQIAMAAGVAEGTLFRAFPDKDAIVKASIHAAFDPAPTEALFSAIDPEAPLREQLIAAVEILQRRVQEVWQLISVLGLTPQAKDGPSRPTDALTRARLSAIFEPHRAELRVEPAYAARMLRMLTFGCSHPRITEDEPLTPAEIVAILLDGIRIRPDLEG